MTMVLKTAAEIWDDYITSGNPSSGKKTPEKTQIREWAGEVEKGALIPNLEFNTVAMLRSYTSLTRVTRATTAGYGAAKDSKGAEYLWDQTDTTSPDTGANIIVDGAARRWKRIAQYSDDDFQPWPRNAAEGDVVPVFPFPPSGFGRDIPANVVELAQTPEYLFSPSGKHFLTFQRSAYGSVITGHTNQITSYNHISNNGISGSGTELTPGGASFQRAVFFFPPYDYPNFKYEDENEIESRPYNNGLLNPAITSPVGDSVMWRPSTYQVMIHTRMSYWFGRKYRGNSVAAHAAGAVHDSKADGYLQKLLSTDNIGTYNGSPILIDQVLRIDSAYRRTDEQEISADDVITGYHIRADMPIVGTIDPRTGGPGYVLATPYRADGLVVDAVALTNRPLATGFAAGQTIVAPGTPPTTVTLTAGMKVLAAAQTTPTENKVYTVPASGAPTAYTPVPNQIYSAYWGVYTNTATNVWTRTFNFSGLPIMWCSADGLKSYTVYAPFIPFDGEGTNLNITYGIGASQYTMVDYGAVNGQVGWEVQAKKAGGYQSLRYGRKVRRHMCFTIEGTKAEGIAKVIQIYQFMKVLQPPVFDWLYWRSVNPHLAGESEDQVRGDWLHWGCYTGRIGKAGQTIVGKPANQSYYDWWRSFVA
jgi:hypothetical protein